MQRENLELKKENEKLREKKDEDRVVEECIDQSNMELQIPTISVNTQESCEASQRVYEIQENSPNCQDVDPLAFCEASLQLSQNSETDILSNMPVLLGFEK